jgi:hypothetical protein
MNVQNPLIVQFWLWGLDAQQSILQTYGFRKLERPSNAGKKSSVYSKNGLYLHANGLWLETEHVLYHRGSERFYHSSSLYFSPEPPKLESIAFQTGLEKLEALILEYERWQLSMFNPRENQLEKVPPIGVRQAWQAWQNFLEPCFHQYNQIRHDLEKHENRSAQRGKARVEFKH